MKISNVLFALFCLFASISYAQVKMGGSPLSINPASLLELESDSQGVLLPRLTIAQRDAQTSWVSGHVIYSIEDSCFQFYDGNIWDCMVGSASVQAQIDSVLNALPPIVDGFGGGGILPAGGSLELCLDCAKQTADGGYILGFAVRFGWTGIAEGFPFNGGLNDIILVKLDANLNISWRKHFGTAHNEVLNFVFQTQDGGYVFGGSVVGGTTAGYLLGNGTHISPTDQLRAYVLKIDSLGNQEWVNKLPDQMGITASHTSIHGAAVELNDGLGFLVGIDGANSTTSFAELAHFDMDGNFVGEIDVNGLNYDYGDIVATSWGYLLIGGDVFTGLFLVGLNSDLSFRFSTPHTQSGGFARLYPATNNTDVFVIGRGLPNQQNILKINSNGGIIWSENYNTAEAQINYLTSEPAIIGQSDTIILVSQVAGTLFNIPEFGGAHEWMMKIDGTNGDILEVATDPYGSEYIRFNGNGTHGVHIFPFQGDKIISFASIVPDANTSTVLGLGNNNIGGIWIFTMDRNMNLEEDRIIIEGN